jgi:electron transfer flavoprotein alpha subunit
MIDVVLVAETNGPDLLPINLEMATLARELGHSITAVVLGHDPDNAAQTLAKQTGFNTIALQSPVLTDYTAEGYIKALTPLLDELKPGFVLIGHTANGSEYAPALATALNAGCITAVESLEMEDGPIFKRAVYGGKFEIRIKPVFQTTVLTISQGSFAPVETPSGSGAVERREIQVALTATRSEGRVRTTTEASGLDKADVVVAGGRGMGKQANLKLLDDLCALLNRAAVAGSRPLCDMGWLPYSRQVGLTGATVSPKLYMAFGISGARQHTAGMKGSGFIVAVSIDPQAPIFSLADVGVVADIKEFIPALIEQLQED